LAFGQLGDKNYGKDCCDAHWTTHEYSKTKSL